MGRSLDAIKKFWKEAKIASVGQSAGSKELRLLNKRTYELTEFLVTKGMIGCKSEIYSFSCPIDRCGDIYDHHRKARNFCGACTMTLVSLINNMVKDIEESSFSKESVKHRALQILTRAEHIEKFSSDNRILQQTASDAAFLAKAAIRLLKELEE